MTRWLFVSMVFTLGAVAQAEEGERTEPWRVEEVVFTSGDVELAGRLWLPLGEGPHPAAVFIPGSGRSIRHLDLDPDPLPHRLAAQGLALLAWDKRGVRDSGGEFEPLPDHDRGSQLARLQLLARDAAAAMSYLASRRDVDGSRVGVWAFSQGGWVASQLEEIGARPAFMILVGAPAVSIDEELRYSAIADAARDASKAGEGPIDMQAIYSALEESEVEQPSQASAPGYDPYPYLERLESPTLFLLGELDLSVPTRRSAARLEVLGTQREWIDHRIFPRANHGVGTTDAAGQWYPAEDFYETQFEYLGNLGILERNFRLRTSILMRTGDSP